MKTIVLSGGGFEILVSVLDLLDEVHFAAVKRSQFPRRRMIIETANRRYGTSAEKDENRLELGLNDRPIRDEWFYCSAFPKSPMLRYKGRKKMSKHFNR